MNWYYVSIILLIIVNAFQLKRNEKLIKKYNRLFDDYSFLQRSYLNECMKRKESCWCAWEHIKKIQFGSDYKQSFQRYLFEQWWETIGRKI